MGRLSAFLCPTELDRQRVVEASGRVRVARSIAAGAMGVALLFVAPWEGWWILGLFALVAANLLTLDLRLSRSAHPESVAAQSLLFSLLMIAVGVALSGGPTSAVLTWLIIPAAMSGTRFRWQVVAALATITAAVMLLTTVPVDPEAITSNPSPLVAALALLVGVTATICALMSGEQVQRDRAVLDSLTGLLNRAALQTRTVEIEQQARLTGGSIALVLFDIDHFKRVNDSYGHERGDAVLRDVAYEMRKSLRTFELAYRIGGEEFLVLLPGADAGEATRVAERVRSGVSHARPGGLELTLSAGVASGSDGELRYDALFRAADEALFRAKREGRDRVRGADDQLPTADSEHRRFPADATAVQLT